MRGWHAAAAGGGLITLTVLAPVVSGTVWANVATPGTPRDPVAPALVVPFEPAAGVRPGGAIPAPGGPVTGPTGLPSVSDVAPPAGTSTDAAATAGATASQGHDEDDEYSGPQVIRPERVREVDDGDHDSDDATATAPGDTPDDTASTQTGSDGHSSDADDD